MTTYRLTEDLPSLIGDVHAAVVASQRARTPAKDAAANNTAPSLQKVLRSSRARAWIPPHLIESLAKMRQED